MSEDTYTHGHHDAVLRSHRWRTAANSAAFLLPRLQPGMSLLDVGCGPGTLTVDLARVVAPGPVTGVDVSAEVVDEARRHGGDSVAFEVGDFRELEGRFDVVHAHQVLQHLRDPVGALAAMAERTAPGGIVAARDSDYPGMAWTPADPRLDRWLEIYLAVTRENGANADAGRQLLRWAHEAGLAEITYSTSTWTFATADDRAWWSDLWAERVTATALAEQAVVYGIATAEELREVAAGWRAWGAAEHGVFVVLHGELVATAARPRD